MFSHPCSPGRTPPLPTGQIRGDYNRCLTSHPVPRSAAGFSPQSCSLTGISLILLLRIWRSGQGKDNAMIIRDEEEEYSDEETKEEKPGKGLKKEMTYF